MNLIYKVISTELFDLLSTFSNQIGLFTSKFAINSSKMSSQNNKFHTSINLQHVHVQPVYDYQLCQRFAQSSFGGEIC